MRNLRDLSDEELKEEYANLRDELSRRAKEKEKHRLLLREERKQQVRKLLLQEKTALEISKILKFSYGATQALVREVMAPIYKARNEAEAHTPECELHSERRISGRRYDALLLKRYGKAL